MKNGKIMSDKMSYPEEIFALRQKRYKTKRRTKLPWQEVTETCRRVNSLPGPSALQLKFPDDFMQNPTGSPAGNHVPANLFDLEFNYNPMAGTATLLGSGGTVVLDDKCCKVEVARYFVGFVQPESCGQCTFCRIGTWRIIEILDRICTGRGKNEDIEDLQIIAERLHDTTLCDLGKNAAIPVLGTLCHFPMEYEEHVRDKVCRAGRCTFASMTTK